MMRIIHLTADVIHNHKASKYAKDAKAHGFQFESDVFSHTDKKSLEVSSFILTIRASLYLICSIFSPMILQSSSLFPPLIHLSAPRRFVHFLLTPPMPSVHLKKIPFIVTSAAGLATCKLEVT